MQFSLHNKDTKKLIATGIVKDFVWHPQNAQKLSLSPGEYWVDIYAEPAEDDFDIEQWEPVEQSNIILLEITDKPPVVWKLPSSYSQYRLIRRIRFQITNDSLFPKVVRWRFSSKQKVISRSWQIPLYVKVGHKKLLQLTASLTLVQLLNQAYEMGITFFSGRPTTTPWLYWLFATVTTSLCFAVVIFFVIRFILSTFWNEAE